MNEDDESDGYYDSESGGSDNNTGKPKLTKEQEDQAVKEAAELL